VSFQSIIPLKEAANVVKKRQKMNSTYKSLILENFRRFVLVTITLLPSEITAFPGNKKPDIQ